MQQLYRDYNQNYLRTRANASWFVSNHTIHTDFNIPYVSEVINERIDKHINKPVSHPNPLVETLTHPKRNKRLKISWTSDFHDGGVIAG